MRLEYLNSNRIDDFISYCKKYKGEIDESFLYDKDLDKFEPNEENPTYIIIDNKEEIVAAASIIIDEYNRRGKKARFRIFHSKDNDFKHYNILLRVILLHTEGLDKVFIFVPFDNIGLRESIERLDFSIERHSFFLERKNEEVKEYELPEDYSIRSFRPGIDEEVYCEIRNKSFANLKGSETPITIKMAEDISSGEEYIEGGIKLLYYKDNPIGIVRGAKDEYEDIPVMNIGPIAIIPEYQGKGLGRVLLRSSLEFAKDKGYECTVLCVNGENERAKSLYIQEGFEQVEGVTCYTYKIDRKFTLEIEEMTNL